jgi:phosphoglycerate dehydrogenase-like enzyme
MSSSAPVVSVLLPEPTRQLVLSPEAMARLSAAATLRCAEGAGSSWRLEELLAGAAVCITGWGTRRLGADVLAAAPSLELIAHTAGSVRNLLPLDEVGRRVRVTHAAALIAPAVAEMVILQMLTALRQLHRLDAGLRAGAPWQQLCEEHPGRLLGAAVVGIVGASRTGREVIRLLHAFGATVLVFDPTMRAEDIAALGAEATNLDDLLRRSGIVSLHAPVLPETRSMIGARELSLMPDGALLVNSARAALVDNGALVDELRSGRLEAALDVFDTEPLGDDSPLRHLETTVLSPHMAGHTRETHLRQGSAMVDEVCRFLRGDPLGYEITADMVPYMA